MRTPSERRTFGDYPPASKEEQSASYSNILEPQGHRQYLQQTPMTSPYSAPQSHYPSSYPIERLSAVSAAPPQYAQSMPQTSSGQPAVVAGSGYLDFGGLSMPPEVMNMDIDPLGMDLSILGAQEHRDYRILEARKQQTQTNTLQSSDSAEGKGRGRRKRAQSDDSETDPSARGRGASRKQRGRPRLDTKDENAADRRRTQIRLAQRAYRLRKETTISSLRTRVTDLETAIEGMQSTFLELQDVAMHCIQENNQRELYGNNLKVLTERFLGLARGALGPGEGGESMGEEDGSEENTGKAPGDSNERRRSRDDEGPSGGMSDQTGSPATYGGYQLSFDRVSSQGSSGAFQPTDTQGGQMTSRSALGTVAPPNGNSRDFLDFLKFGPPLFVNNPAPAPALTSIAIPPELDSFSYSYQEASFSRRLHRAALERAFWLLTSPSADENEVARTFAYTFCYASRDDVIRSIATRLQSGRNGSLDSDDYPELRKTPRRPYDYRDQLAAFENKPLSSPTSDHQLRRAKAYKDMLSLGIKDKFLRPDDVEAILVEKGILTFSSSPESTSGSSNSQPDSILEVELPTAGHVSPASSASSLSDAQEARTPEDTTSTSPSFRRLSDPDDYDELDTKLLFESMGHTQPADPQNMLTHTSGAKIFQGVKKFVDFDVLVKELLKRGVCLGRFPGFSKADVDAALSIASTIS